MKDNKLERIYEAVYALMREKQNPSAITISEIAERSDIGKGTIYEYFTSKEEVFYSAYAHMLEDIIEAITPHEDESFRDSFMRFLGAVYDAYDKYKYYGISAFFANTGIGVSPDPEQEKLIAVPLNTLNNTATELIMTGVRQGVIASTFSSTCLRVVIGGIVAGILNDRLNADISIIPCSCGGHTHIVPREELLADCYNSLLTLLGTR